MMQNRVVSGLFWKLFERIGVQGVQFILQIILARILTPDHYGILSLMLVFTNLATIFVQNGLNTALIQNKDVSDEDYSSVFWLSLGISISVYILLFVSAPFIAVFYDMPEIIAPFRILSLMLIPGAFNSVQLSKISREMNFKQVFKSNLVAIVIAGIFGIVLAFLGAGVWALVVQTLLNVIVACVVMWFTVNWRPQLVFNFKRIKVLFSFGWKLLVSSLLDTAYTELRSLIIGRKYDSDTLGYYNRGKQFPQFAIGVINSAVQSVLLPAMSEQQETIVSVKSLMRKAMTMSAYIIFPMMAGLAAVASPLVEILLTDKWLSCVPYLQIYCFTLAFTPVHTCNLQAINALGRSDIFLKLEIIKKIFGVLILLMAVVSFDSPIAIALTGIITTLVSWLINAYPNNKLIQYTYVEQLKDVMPSLIMSLIMCVLVYGIGNFISIPGIALVVQITVGVIVYVLLSAIIKPQPYTQMIKLIQKFMNIKRRDD